MSVAVKTERGQAVSYAEGPAGKAVHRQDRLMPLTRQHHDKLRRDADTANSDHSAHGARCHELRRSSPQSSPRPESYLGLALASTGSNHRPVGAHTVDPLVIEICGRVRAVRPVSPRLVWRKPAGQIDRLRACHSEPCSRSTLNAVERIYDRIRKESVGACGLFNAGRKASVMFEEML